MTDLPPASTWREPCMLRALAVRDVGAVYRHLAALGLSQRRIAACIGQSQSEVSEVLSGRRVGSYDVLVRIADGLGIPRGLMGLGYSGDGGVSIVDLPAMPPPDFPAMPPPDLPPTRMRVVNIQLCQRCTAEPTIETWTGVEVTALRQSLRMTVRAFSRYIGVSDRMISKWESGAGTMRPAAINQQALDTVLSRADPLARRRFALALAVAATVER